MAVRTYLLIITLNVHGLNVAIKLHTVAEWIKKHDAFICCLQNSALRCKDTYRQKLKWRKKISPESGNKQQQNWGSCSYMRQNIL